MEDSGDPSPDFEPLFIQEENGDPGSGWSDLAFTRTRMSPTSLMGPYLREMDDLLKNCEELTVIPLESDSEGSLAEREISPYFSTSCAGNKMEMTEDRVRHRFQEDLPITSAGNELSNTMVQYEGQLMGMLAMLESCMEEAGMDLDVSQDYVHVDKGKDLMSENQHCKASTDSCGTYPSIDLSESNVHNHHFESDTFEVNESNGTKFPTESLKMDRSFSMDGFEELKSQMEECIEELQRLERRRKDLLAEVLDLRRQEAQKEEAAEAHVSSKVSELMAELKKEENDRKEQKKREVDNLKSERAEEERRVWKAEMERQVLRDEMRKLKKQLFERARDSAHTQAALNKQRHEMDFQKREKENLQRLFLQMTEEGSQLRSAHQKHIQDLQEKLRICRVNQTSNTTQEELSKRNSCGDIQQYLQESLKTLENKYEPVLLALQKRKETTTGAVVKAKQHTRELKVKLGPLREEMQSQVLQRARLEEKVKLVHIQRREEAAHYEVKCELRECVQQIESISCLERSSRELKMELTIQRRKNKEAAELKDRLAKQIILYRSATTEHREET
nr:trichohyalin-like [Nerophis lumbriciformis]